MKRTIVFEQTVKIQQAVDVEYDNLEQLNEALEQTEACEDIYQVAHILNHNDLNVLGVSDELDFNIDYFEYYDDYEIKEEKKNNG